MNVHTIIFSHSVYIMIYVYIHLLIILLIRTVLNKIGTLTPYSCII